MRISIRSLRDCLSKYRYPFLPLFLAACGGVLLGEAAVPFAEDFSLGFILPAIAALAAALLLLQTVFSPSSLAFWPGVILCFSALQLGAHCWSPGRLLARQIGAETIVVEAVGRVTEPPRPSFKGWKFSAEMQSPLGLRSGTPVVNTPTLVHWQGNPPTYGDAFRAIGSLRGIPLPRNPGEFDARQWLGRKGIGTEWVISSAADTEILATGKGNPLLALAQEARMHIEQTLSAGLAEHPQARALLLAMTIGDTSGLEEALREDFRVTGTLHLFSVSGLHVGMLAVLLWIVLKPLRLPLQVLVPLLIVCLFFYATITGLRPASIRAAFMASVVLGGLLLARPATPLNSLAAAGFFLLCINPQELFNPGFQLSFSVVLAILLFGVPLAKILRERAGPDPFLPRKLYGRINQLHAWGAREIGSLAAVSFSAWVGSLPLIASYYGIVSLSAIATNLLAVPLAFAILAVAMLSLLGGMLSLWVAAVFNHTNLLLTSALLGLIQIAAEVPGGYFRLGELEFSKPQARIVLFDLGGGESNFLSLGKQNYLLDTGSVYASERTVQPNVLRNGGKLQGIFLTHGDAAHGGGAELASKRFRPDFVAVSGVRDRSRTLRSLFLHLEKEGIPKRILRAGDRFLVSPAWEVEVLFPPQGWKRSRADDCALVTRWVGCGVSILFFGDAGLDTEEWLLEHAASRLAADVLVIGRHGAGQPGLAKFLDAVSPQAVVASAADFPPKEALPPAYEELVGARGIPLFRKDQTGAVILEINHAEVSLRGFLPPAQSLTWKPAPLSE